MYKWAFALCALLAISFGAYAGVDKNPVVENLQRPFDWTGFYLGANIGGVLSEYEFRGTEEDGHLFSDVDFGQQLAARDDLFPDFSDIFVFRFVDQGLNDRPDRESFVSAIMGGGQVGYQHQWGHWVLGIEADIDRTSIRNTQNFRGFVDDEIDLVEDGTFDIDVTSASFHGRRTAETNWLGSVRLKVGYATGPLLFYATGGVAFAGIDVWAHDQVTTMFESELKDVAPAAPNGFIGEQSFHIANASVEKDDDVMVGYTAGAGVEIAFNDAVSLALEYRHNDYGDESFHFSNNNSHGPIFSGGTNVDFSSDQVTVRMNVLLNHMFGNGAYTSASPAKNNVAVRSPFGDEQSVGVGYTKAKDTDKWSAKDKEITKVEELFNWTGFYVGANAGGAWTDYDFSGYDNDVDVTTALFQNLPLAANRRIDAPTGPGIPSVFAPFHAPSIDGGSDDSIIGGGQLGYQHQFGHFVVGVEADFSGLSSGKETDFAASSFEFIDKFALAQANLYSQRKVTQDWIGSARLKLGYARGPVMLYITGGAAWSQVRMWANDLVVTDYFFPRLTEPGIDAPSGNNQNFIARSTNNTNDEDVAFGWTIGGGAEWAFSKIASLAMEYRHTGFDSADAHYDAHHTPIFGSGNSVDMDTDQVTVRLNLLLGHMGPGH